MMGNIKILSRHVNENKSLFKFSNKVKFYQVLLRLFPVCFPGFTSHEIGKISLKTIKRGCIKMVKCTPLILFLAGPVVDKSAYVCEILQQCPG